MLFDMVQDPGETKNLAFDQRMSGVLAEHRKLLKDWIDTLDVATA